MHPFLTQKLDRGSTEGQDGREKRVADAFRQNGHIQYEFERFLEFSFSQKRCPLRSRNRKQGKGNQKFSNLFRDQRRPTSPHKRRGNFKKFLYFFPFPPPMFLPPQFHGAGEELEAVRSVESGGNGGSSGRGRIPRQREKRGKGREGGPSAESADLHSLPPSFAAAIVISEMPFGPQTTVIRRYTLLDLGCSHDPSLPPLPPSLAPPSFPPSNNGTAARGSDPVRDRRRRRWWEWKKQRTTGGKGGRGRNGICKFVLFTTNTHIALVGFLSFLFPTHPLVKEQPDVVKEAADSFLLTLSKKSEGRRGIRRRGHLPSFLPSSFSEKRGGRSGN